VSWFLLRKTCCISLYETWCLFIFSSWDLLHVGFLLVKLVVYWCFCETYCMVILKVLHGDLFSFWNFFYVDFFSRETYPMLNFFFANSLYVDLFLLKLFMFIFLRETSCMLIFCKWNFHILIFSVKLLCTFSWNFFMMIFSSWKMVHINCLC